MDKSWMHVPNRFTSCEYGEGNAKLLTMAKAHAPGKTTFRCPCRRCHNNLFLSINEVEDHLFTIGIDPSYTHWIFHGEAESLSVNSSDDETDTFNEGSNFVDDMGEMIDDIRVGSFMDHASGEHGTTSQPSMSEGQSKTFDQLLEDARRPLYPSCLKFSKLSFIVKLLHIKTCDEWTIKSFNIVLQLLKASFPEIQIPNSYHEARRLQCGLGFSYVKIDAYPNDCMLFRKDSADKQAYSKCNESRWVTTRGKRGTFPKSWFAEDARNVRLGLASDGFNPFNNMSKPYSIWPVILVPYNLPPWLCMKERYLMLSLLIPGPKGPRNDIDVYLQPLVNELKVLWNNGVHTYDASKSEHFRLHATLLWTINDFPAYANLSGWSTKGKMACPLCNEDTNSIWLKHGRKYCYMGHRRFLPAAHSWRKKKVAFNGKQDDQSPPPEFMGHDLLQQLMQLDNVEFGKGNQKRKRRLDELNWTKQRTLMDIEGKTKDTATTRKDLMELGLRKELHLQPSATGCVSVSDGKISGMKSYDCHVFMQRLLPVAIGGFFRPDIRLALTKFSSFFKALCARALTLEVLK
ncbi:uncharacterized protein LOC121267174 [Juglans microcarpa x Juglans regia]|uniref:uncharacterized protein LOC121267174 n=1 Tax=Juglans microcarpa x Juglans regia TaxID=2249226 RepID=UPI001B7F10F4|nr:uncharacterized protein LOC121267174 [Juglans microcarpa x Juglans regia]